jgi:erythrocyte band 7 integral membrane protein
MLSRVSKFTTTPVKKSCTRIPKSDKSQKRNFLRIVPQNYRGIRTFLGAYEKNKRVGNYLTPGLWFRIPFVHQINLISIEEQIYGTGSISLLSADNVAFTVDATIHAKAKDNEVDKAILNVHNVWDSLAKVCKNELRKILSTMTIDEILKSKNTISISVLAGVSQSAEEWGIKVIDVTINDIILNSSMLNAMGAIAEATRQAEAKIISAKADIEVAQQYNQSAQIYNENPITMRLRELDAWKSISKNPATTIYVVPSDLTTILKSNKL